MRPRIFKVVDWLRIFDALERQTANVCESIWLQSAGNIILHSVTHAASSSTHNGMERSGFWIGLQPNPIQHEQEHWSSITVIDTVIFTKHINRTKNIVVSCISL
jgi:hypothetical protein